MRLQEEKRKEGPLSVSIPCMAVSHLSDLAVLLIGDLRMLFAKTRTVFKRIGGPEQKLSVPVVLKINGPQKYNFDNKSVRYLKPQ